MKVENTSNVLDCIFVDDIDSQTWLINRKFQTFSIWFKVNKLLVVATKTNYMMMSRDGKWLQWKDSKDGNPQESIDIIFSNFGWDPHVLKGKLFT